MSWPVEENQKHAELKCFVAIDFETALAGDFSSVCEIGLVKVQDGRIVDEYCQLIKPPKNLYSISNINCHGIHPHDTVNSPTFDQVWNVISQFLADNILVAHNVPFDRNCLESSLDFYGIKDITREYFCTYRMTKCPLSLCCDELGIGVGTQHRALDDARACAQVYLKVQNGAVVNPSMEKVLAYRKVAKAKRFSSVKLTGEIIKAPDLSQCCPDSPLYGKKVVFTGQLLAMSRCSAAEKAKELGAKINVSVSAKTDILVVGSDPGDSKMDKVRLLNEGGVVVKTMGEEEFLRLLSYKKLN